MRFFALISLAFVLALATTVIAAPIGNNGAPVAGKGALVRRAPLTLLNLKTANEGELKPAKGFERHFQIAKKRYMAKAHKAETRDISADNAHSRMLQAQKAADEDGNEETKAKKMETVREYTASETKWRGQISQYVKDANSAYDQMVHYSTQQASTQHGSKG